MIWRHVFICSLLLAAAGCSSRPTEPSHVVLGHTFGSAEELAAAVLDGFARNDASGLRDLALTEEEFRDHVWPHLPASRPERNVPLDYAWGQLRQRSEEKLTDLLETHGGRRYTLEAVTFTGATTDYGPFRVTRDSRLRLRDEEGRTVQLSLFGSMLVAGNQHKVFSFAVDD